MESWKAAYSSLEEIEAFGDNALGLYALGLKFGVEDLASVGAESVTDGSDDKKLDLVYLNSEEGFAVVAQCYFSEKDKDKAKANKASDLNTGVAWLLQRDIGDVPERIKSAAINLRNAIENKLIDTIHFWYVHNLPESEHVGTELVTVQQTAKTILSKEYPDTHVEVYQKEVGNNTLSEWYEDCKTPILINETLSLDCLSGYEVNSEEWTSYSTAIRARDLSRLYKKHKTKIFSANIRDYLGSRSSDSNINNGIKRTIDEEPVNFWAYNNGLTILTHGYEVTDNKIELQGISIVNGAQTTGAVGSLSKLPSEDALVQARFIAVTSDNNPLIESIIRYNNSQNKVEAADFRSTDRVQKRLKSEFESLPDAEYEGGRRGSSGDVIRRRPNLIGSYSVGQSLAAFHGDPIIAYNQKAGIWINNRLYDKYFNDNTKAPHIVAAYALVKAIEQHKRQLQTKVHLTSSEADILNFLRQRGANYLTTYAISSCLEIILGRTVPNLYRISFGWNCTPKEAIDTWKKIIDVLLPFVEHLNPCIENGLKNMGEVSKAVKTFTALVSSTKGYNAEVFEEFKAQVSAP